MTTVQRRAYATSKILPMNKPDTTIDIYADNPVVTLAYKIAVMQKALELGDGSVQGAQDSGCKWVCVPQYNVQEGYRPEVKWNWVDWVYRIDPNLRPFVMPGRNPFRINQFHVGLDAGWRLLHEDEFVQCRFERHWADCEVAYTYIGAPDVHVIWRDISRHGVDFKTGIVRTKLTKEQFAA